ncbi:C-terminal novel E3 ligase, LRR-interacting [Pseudomonas sp. NFR09]|uniref:dermonecrotic toxin domain-containing protein n=1 Tax=Pseudomonas sp. NFR09 TaxID=1566249 RepID=UPI0008CE9659|nr:DUF6543 domain-containing protein [Pseudomonas sp. NFR09]SEU19492.1 C-terminal novel E3 ligase, LRR-interacting [Pseudomonas sp. NFR09]
MPVLSTADQTPPPVSDSQHHALLENAVPDWLKKATASQRDALKTASTELPDWYQRAPAARRSAFETSIASQFAAQSQLDTTLSRLQDLDTFARPLLVNALKDRFNVELDVDKTFIRLRKTVSISEYYIPAGWFEALKLPLLQAALHNFEASECEAGAFHSSSGFVVLAASGDCYNPITTTLTVEQFTGLCRSLDIGAKYQAYLKGFLEPDNAVAQAVLQERFTAAHKCALRAAAEQALLKNDITEADYRMVLSVIAGEKEPVLNGKRIWLRDLSLAQHRLTGVVVFLVSGELHNGSELLLYVPGDPQAPLKRYTLGQLKPLFKQRFTTPDTPPSAQDGPTVYQRFFSQFVDYAERADYFSQFTQNAPDTTILQDLAPYQALIDQIRRGIDPFYMFSTVHPMPPPAPPRQVPNPDPYLDPVITSPAHGGWFWGENLDLWTYLYEQYRARLYADARAHAVPTADVDARVRSRKLAQLLNIGMLLFTGVSMFIPALGEAMMAVMSTQLLLDTFEGVREWSEGDRKAAKAHLIDVAQNLVMLAAMVGAGRGFAKLIPVPAEPVVEATLPVMSTDGKTRLWKPDLAPYRAGVNLAPDAQPDAQGLYRHEGQTILPLEGHPYRVTHDAQNAEYRIAHPTRPEAYSPRLTQNHEGAWRHEGEHPLDWDDTTALRRLGHTTAPLDTEQLLNAQHASGVTADALRETHMNSDTTPLLLADSLQRFKIHQQVSTFIQQLKSTDPFVFPKADLGAQLDLMKRRGLLSGSPPLRVIDTEGRVLWDDEPSLPSQRRRIVRLTEQQLERGEGLREVLGTLQGTDPDLVDIPGSPQDTLPMRAAKLRRQLGEFVESIKPSYVQERYRQLTASTDADVQRVQDAFPTLPTRIAEQLLSELSAQQLEAFRASARLPDTLAELAQWAEQETRVSRAYENLHLNTPFDLDSQRLALRTLETLPGWRRGTRVELRQRMPGDAEDLLLDAIGEVDSTPVKTLVQLSDGQFEGNPSTDVYDAIVNALSPGERIDMKLADAAQLRAAIQSQPLPREALRALLLEHPVRKPAYDPTMRLLGGGRGFEKLKARLSSSAQRVRKLYPSFSDAQVDTFIESMGSDVRSKLTRREAEYRQLEDDLNTWVEANKPRTAGSQFDRAGGYAGTVARDIKRCWRRESGTALKFISGMPLDLPALTADFSHVTELELHTRQWSANAQTFLNNFTQVEKLSLVNCELTTIPEGLDRMPRLTQLRLSQNKIVLTPDSAAQLSALHPLESLELSGNRLGRTPDVSAMHGLKRLDLSYTGIEQWPTGLQDKTGLEFLNLRGNRLREVPDLYLDPPPEQLEAIAGINNVTFLKGNPLPDTYRSRFDAYWRRLGDQRPDLIKTHDVFDISNPPLERARALYPNRNALETRQFIWGLGEGLEAELQRLEREFAQLNTQLNTWASAGGNVNNRTGTGYVRTEQRALNALGRDDRYLAKNRIIACWRKETPAKLAFDGTPIGLELDLSGLNLQSLPELDADFSHVGSLKLNNMQLSTSPEQFLLRHRGVRWLDISQNQLRELPAALNEMNGLTRLWLHGNQIQLSAHTAQVLAQRSTLRLLTLAYNPLRVAPDFSAITDMRTLNMRNCELESFPTGLGAQPSLVQINLAGNRISSLPEALINPPDEQLAQSSRLTHLIEFTGNPLTEAAREQLNHYRARLEQAGLSSVDHPDNLVSSALRLLPPPRPQAIDQAQARRWMQAMSPTQISTRMAQWEQLRAQPGSDGFFAMLKDMREATAGHADLQARVWAVIDAITPNTVESAALREQMFEWAGRPTCCDRAGLSFSNVEVMTMVHNAKALASDVSQGAALIKLSRGLLRLDEVEKAALQDIARRTQAINDNPALSAVEKAQRIALLEEVEIRLAYRFELKNPDQLDLPGQPQTAIFTRGRVSAEALKKTREDILKLNDSPAEFQALVSRDFWQEYLTHKYRARFEAQSEPFHTSLEALHRQHAEGRLSQANYEHQAKDLQAQLAIEEASLMETLTRTELQANPVT